MAQMEVIYKLHRTRCYFGELCIIWIIFGNYGMYTFVCLFLTARFTLVGLGISFFVACGKFTQDEPVIQNEPVIKDEPVM